MRKLIVGMLVLAAIAAEIFIGSRFGAATASGPPTIRPNSATPFSTAWPQPANRITVRGVTFIVERDVTPAPDSTRLPAYQIISVGTVTIIERNMTPTPG